MARDLPGLGPSEIAPQFHREFDFAKVKLGPAEYFMISRVDGKTSFAQLVAIAGVPEGQALTILRHLRQVGAIYLPGEDPKRPPAPEPELADERVAPVVIDESLLAEEVELTEAQKRIILLKHASLAGGTYFSVLEIGRDADKKKMRAARDRITKDFHPDRALYFKKELGSFRRLLAQITELAVEAYDVLSDDTRRETYVMELAQARLAAASPPSPGPGYGPGHGNGNGVSSGGQTPVREAPRETPAQETAKAKKRAIELYNAASIHEATGELGKALVEFKEAVSLDPRNARIQKRTAEAFLNAQSLKDAEEYAKSAAELEPSNADCHRIYGKVLRRQGRLPEARAALERASKLDPGNPHIAAELRGVIEGENG